MPNPQQESAPSVTVPVSSVPDRIRQESDVTVATGPRLVEPDEKANSVGDGLEFTDVDNAVRLIRCHGKNIRYCPQLKCWYIWDGLRWRKDEEHRIVELAKDTAHQLQIVAGTIAGRESAEKWFKFALSSKSRQRLDSMVTLASSDPRVVAHPDEFDKDPDVLNCLDGTINLRNGRLSPHNRKDLISKLTPVHYDVESEPTHWLEFLKIAMQRTSNPASVAAMIDYLQRAIGYTLTGSTHEAAIFIPYGGGNNGKSIFTWGADQLLGEYACSAEPETLMSKKRDGSGPNGDVARLKGVRLVRAAESDIGQRLNESLLKRMTGGEKLVASFKYGHEFEYLPSFKIWLPTNHKPSVRGTDKGIWRRLKLIPFTVDIPASLPAAKRKDRSQVQAELTAEMPAILAWAVRGATMWYQSGLKEPNEVTDATKEYKQEMDSLGNFIDECCVTSSDKMILRKQLFGAYQQWCDDNNEYALSGRQFGTALGEKGFLKNHDGTGNTRYLGLALVVKGATVPASIAPSPVPDPTDLPF